MSSRDVKWEWRPKRSSVGALACWILLAVGLAFVVYGLCFCRDAIERPAEEFRYSFVPLFVLVSIGLVLMLSGAIGIMCMEISGHAQAIRRLVQQAVGMISSGITDHAHEMQTTIKELRADIDRLMPDRREPDTRTVEDPKIDGPEVEDQGQTPDGGVDDAGLADEDESE
ncbi:MAG: hypothetical protein GXP25_12020 [Planctomycetes bacterium]|nr:hypothetical protein [Planctomycetota bacterium]